MATVQEKGKALLTWLGGCHPLSETAMMDLNEAIYILNESGLWPDNIEIRNVSTAIMCWQLVQKLSERTLPDYCKL